MNNAKKSLVPHRRFKEFQNAGAWEQRKLGELTKFINGRAYSQDELLSDGKYKVLRVGNFYTNDAWYYSNMELNNKYYANNGDLLYTWSATFGPHIWDGGRVIYHYHIWKLDLTQQLNKLFAVQLLIRDRNILESNTNGSTMAHITKKGMEEKIVSVPSNLKEQEAIGRFLTKLDDIITLHQRKLNKLKKLKSAYLTEMFPDEGEHKPKRRFAGFTDDWEQRKFSEILAKSDGLRRGPFGSALKKEFFISSSEYTVYEQNNAIYNTWKTRYFITPEKFQELHKFQLVPGDFILSGAGTIGRIAQVPANITKGVFNQALIRIRINPEWMDKNFFLIWMQSENMQRKLTQANPGSAMTNLVPMSEIKKWEIIIPSKAEQNKIGEFIQKLNSLIALHQRKIDKLQKLKNAYLNEMFV